MYLPYYAHLLWNNWERLLILSSAVVNDEGVKQAIQGDLEAIIYFWKSIGWCLLRYVVYANKTLNEGNYIRWVETRLLHPLGGFKTAREAGIAYTAFAKYFPKILTESGCFVEHIVKSFKVRVLERSRVPELSLDEAMVLARAALVGDAVPSSGSGEGASKRELHETAERLGLRF